MTMQVSITVIVPALNEQGNIEGTIQEILPVLESEFKDYEILIFNDGSSDKTGEISERIAQANPKIKVIHNAKPMGLGYNYKKGVSLATQDYVIMVPGDNDLSRQSFLEIAQSIGKKDIVIPYTGNMEIRPKGRQILSHIYTVLMNFLFGLNIKYFNGTVVHKRPLIQGITIETDGFAYQAEALIKLLRQGQTYLELPMYLKERSYGKSKALRPRNIYRVIKAVLQLFYQIRIRKN